MARVEGSRFRGPTEQDIRNAYARRWRKRKLEADRDLEDLKDENVLHRAWRKASRRPWPEDPYESEVAQLSRTGRRGLAGVDISVDIGTPRWEVMEA